MNSLLREIFPCGYFELSESRASDEKEGRPIENTKVRAMAVEKSVGTAATWRGVMWRGAEWSGTWSYVLRDTFSLDIPSIKWE